MTPIVTPPAVTAACSSGDEPWLLMRSRVDVDRERLTDALYQSFHVEEVDVAPSAAPVLPDRRTHPRAAERAPFSSATRETDTELEQPHIALLPPAVVGDGIDEPRQQRRPQDGEVLGQRIRDWNEAAIAGERRRDLGSDEAEGDRFREPAPVITLRSRRARAVRGSIAGAAETRGGNVAGIRSKP
jgi:hypothetical protein